MRVDQQQPASDRSPNVFWSCRHPVRVVWRVCDSVVSIVLFYSKLTTRVIAAPLSASHWTAVHTFNTRFDCRRSLATLSRQVRRHAIGFFYVMISSANDTLTHTHTHAGALTSSTSTARETTVFFFFCRALAVRIPTVRRLLYYYVFFSRFFLRLFFFFCSRVFYFILFIVARRRCYFYCWLLLLCCVSRQVFGERVYSIRSNAFAFQTFEAQSSARLFKLGYRVSVHFVIFFFLCLSVRCKRFRRTNVKLVKWIFTQTIGILFCEQKFLIIKRSEEKRKILNWI